MTNPRLALALLATLAIAGCTAQPTPAPAARSTVTPAERGQYLVTIMACNDCHTPFRMGPSGPEPDMARLLSGHPAALRMPAAPPLSAEWAWAGAATNTAFAGPWGVSYAANLTPDEKTGLGSWDEEMFIRALRLGKHMGASRPIQPPMPWSWIGKMTDEDLKAVYTYLRSVPAIANEVPPWTPPAGAK
jgi:mono/diheme cytochrome c family protein